MALVESSRLWTTGGAGDGASTYTRDNMAEMFRNMLLADFTTQGILNGLAVSGSASPLTMATGAACVYGFLHFCTTSGSLPAITTPAVGTTGGRVSLRADWTAQTVRAVCVRNTDGVSAIPALTQTAGTTWDIPLATFTITTGGVITLTDARAFVANPSKVFTATRIPFATTGGQLSDDSNMIWDNTNKRLGIGTASPGKAIDVGTGQIQISSGLALPLRGRQGGSSSGWNVTGSTNQSLVAPRVQCGSRAIASGGTSITFPVAFSQAPIVVVTPQTPDTAAVVTGIGASSMTITTYDLLAGGAAVVADVYWLAIGPE